MRNLTTGGPIDPRLQEAVKELLLASEGFRRAYDLWSRAPQSDASWERALLADAEARLDSARGRVQDAESAFRHTGAPPETPPREG